MSGSGRAVETMVPVQMQWGVKILLRDGVQLSATLYLPRDQKEPAPAIVTLTPYVAQQYHDFAVYFATQGYPFLTVDVRGRGDSEGDFEPNFNEGRDGYDVVKWLAGQPYCNGRVAMWGGSYGGHAQWNAAREFPPHLETIVPVASPYLGVDFPLRRNIPTTYLMRWLSLVSGRVSQERVFNDEAFWGGQFRTWFEQGLPFEDLDSHVGNPSAIFQEWVSHPEQDSYWEGYNPTPEHYAGLDIPILTITGIYDGDQLGALTHYRQHVKYASPQARAKHYLIIGPWDHAGTRVPRTEFAGIRTGPASLVDLRQLHVDWYAWVMRGGSRPGFLRNNVAYYLMGAECWRYADSLEAITARAVTLYLGSSGNPTDVLHSGSLSDAVPEPHSEPDEYVYDPRDVILGGLEAELDPEDRSEQRMVYAAAGRQLVYHSAPFDRDTELSGFFRLSVWLSIDQPDTDFRASVYEAGLDGRSFLLTADWMRARYRESSREEKLVRTTEPLLYDFKEFTFVSRLVRRGCRLRLVVGPINSIHSQKNYNTGGRVAAESMQVARTATVRLFHDEARPSGLHVPLGRCDASHDGGAEGDL